MNNMEKKLTGYPSLDKPWLKYYSEEAINAPMPSGNMYDYIWTNNKDHLSDIALVYFGKKITYDMLFNNIKRTIAAFQSIDVKAGDVVSFISILTPELVYCFYALNRIGAIVNMLDPRSSERTLIEQIVNTESKTLVVLDQCMEHLEAITEQVNINHIIRIRPNKSMGFPFKQLYSVKTAMNAESPSLSCNMIDWDVFIRNTSFSRIEVVTEANTPACIWYTGGTTGEPKGVLLSNLNVNSVAEQYRVVAKDHFRQQTWLTVSAPFIAYAMICGLHLPLSYGMICCIELYNPSAIAKTIVKKKYNHAAVTPIVWENIISNPAFKNTDFSFLVAPASGADYMSPKLENDINRFFETHNCGWKICQGYGMTEASSGIAFCASNDCYKPGSVGFPLPNTVIATYEIDSVRELLIGEIGEVCICGPGIMLGYYNNPQATGNVIKQHPDGKYWLHTGDLGKIDEDGNLFITGRIKRMITRSDGFKVFPSAVEEKILMHPAIEKCSVVGKQDPNSVGGQLPVAFLVLKNERTDLCDSSIMGEIKEICNKALPEYSRPVQFYIRDSFPLTSAGKIDYRALEREAAKER